MTNQTTPPTREQKTKKKTSSGTWGCLVLVIIFGIIGLISLSGNDSSNSSTPSSTPAPASQVEEASNAFKLASLEIGHNNPPQSLIDVFDNYLSELATKCPSETKTQIAGYIFKTQEMINERGGDITLKGAAEGINGSLPDEASGTVSCAEVAAAFVTLVAPE